MRNLRPFHVTIIIAVCYVVYVIAAFGSPLALVTPGSDFSPNEVFIYSEEGYDGQFVYYIARDPFGAADLIDVPAYRYQRILLPILGWLLGVGQAALIPYSLLLVNLVALGASTFILENLLAEMGISRWYALGYALSLAALGNVRLTLPETLAYGLCIGGLWMIHREYLSFSALLFALAALTKETTLVFAAGIGFYILFDKGFSRAALFGIVVLMPFVMWQATLRQWFGSFGVGSGGDGTTGFEFIPFMGLIRIITEGNFRVFAALMVLIVPFVLLPTFWGLWRCWKDFRGNRWTFFSWLLLVNAAIMLFVPFSTYREINAILRFIAGLQIAVILYGANQRNIRVLRYSTFWALTSLVLIMSDVALASG